MRKTQQGAFEHFKEIYKDQPELVKLARPEALPASVQVMVHKGANAKDRRYEMESVYPDAKVFVQEWCPGPE
jgi:hypothetical protein